MRNILLGCVILSCVYGSNDLLASVIADDSAIIQSIPDKNGKKKTLPLPDFARKRERGSDYIEEAPIVSEDETPQVVRKPRVKHKIPENQEPVRAKRNLFI